MKAIKGFPHRKSPSVDGYSTKFFAQNWERVKVEVLDVFQELSTNSKMNQSFSGSIISLISKVTTPTYVMDYSHITY